LYLESSSASSSDITVLAGLQPLLRRFLLIWVLARRPNPNWKTGVSLLVWVITCDLSDIEGPTNSYATASTAIRIILSSSPTIPSKQ
jgi:hypothetical protein